ncbi:MAG: GTP-binding protein HSR1 [Deltaproteobacteria bacterium]|nr:MAG: GTP-binding protein HSR1 [Deltaproteobacteria bacterium]
MPANLPPHYFEAEQRYREAKTPAEKIAALEEMLTIMPKHKGTDKLRASLRQKISKLKNQAQKKKATTSKRDPASAIEKEGAGRLVITGMPNVGKSSLVRAVTNATPEVADFPHTTWKPVPGMMPFENIQIQVVDTPPLNPDYNEPWLIELMKRSDLLGIMVDLHADPIQQLEMSLDILKKYKVIDPAYLEGRKPEDERKRKPIPIIIANKNDNQEDDEIFEIFCELTDVPLPKVNISSKTGYNLNAFSRTIFDLLGVIRFYSKAPGKEPDLNAPFILPKNSTLLDFAGKIHKDFVKKLKYAKIWGKKVFDGQMVQRSHVLEDGDIVEIHI